MSNTQIIFWICFRTIVLNDWSLDAYPGGLSHLHPHDLAFISVGVSKWQLKEKMNMHHAHHLPSCLLPFSIPIHTTTYILIFQYPLNPFPSPPSITGFAMHSPTHSFSFSMNLSHHVNALPLISPSLALITHNSSHTNSSLCRTHYHIHLSIFLTNHAHLISPPSSLSTSSYPFSNHPTNPFLILCPYHPCHPWTRSIFLTFPHYPTYPYHHTYHTRFLTTLAPMPVFSYAIHPHHPSKPPSSHFYYFFHVHGAPCTRPLQSPSMLA